MGRGKSAVTIEREEYIVDLLKAEAGESVTGSTFDRDLGISANNRCWLISGLKKRYPQIKNTTPIGSEATYAWIEPKVEEQPKVIPVSEAPSLNPPKLESIKSSKKAQPGEVWATMESNGSRALVYVLSAINGYAQCIKLYSETSNKVGKLGKDYFMVNVGKKSYVGDPNRVGPKPVKYLLHKEAEADGVKLLEVRWMLAGIFGIKTPEPKEIIKEVKVSPDPDLKIENDYLRSTLKALQEQIKDMKAKEAAAKEPEMPDDWVSASTARLAIITEERNIWKTVALKLLDKE